MLSRIWRGRDKKIAPYSLGKTAGNYVFTTQPDCSSEELILFLLDLHMYVNPLNQEEMHRFPDPTECVQYSFVVDASSSILRSIDLLKVLKIGFTENSFESSNELRDCSDDQVICAVRDLAILGNRVPVGRGGYGFAEATSVMPLDGILACMDILISVLNTSQCFLEREFSFTYRLLPALVGLFFVLDKLGSSIGHATNDVTKYQWTQTIGQATKYLSNVAINTTVHNVNCTMDMDQELPPLHGSRSFGLLVCMLEMLANCVVKAREWCHPEAASTVALLFWSMADTVSDAVLHLQSKDRYTVVSRCLEEEKSERPAWTLQSLWQHGEFVSVVTHTIFTCVSNASPSPQDLLAGIGRLAGRSTDAYGSDLSADLVNDTRGMLNWCTVAHTVTGFKCLLRAAIFSATGDRIALPRQNEWIAAIAESLLFCLEFGYKTRNLTLLAPVMAELLLELVVRQSDCSINIDVMFFELAKHLNKFSDACKKKSRLEKKKKQKKRPNSAIQANYSKSADHSDGNEGSMIDLTKSDESVRRAASADNNARPGDLTVDNFRKHNLVNRPRISRISTEDTSSFDGSTHTDLDDFTRSPHRNLDAFFGSSTNKKLYTIVSSDSMRSNSALLDGQLPDVSLKSNRLQPLHTPFPVKLSPPDSSSVNDGSTKSKKMPLEPLKYINPLSPSDCAIDSTSNSNLILSPQATRPHTAPAAASTGYDVGQMVDCRVVMKNESVRWFSGKIETIKSDGTFDVRFDDGDLGANKSSSDIRTSKRSGRMSARSPSQRSEASLSSRMAVASPPALSLIEELSHIVSVAPSESIIPSLAGSGVESSPALFMNKGDATVGENLNLQMEPISKALTSESASSSIELFDSMSYSADDEDKRATKPYRPSSRMQSILPKYASDLSSVADFGSMEIRDQYNSDVSVNTSKELNSLKDQLVMTEFLSHDQEDDEDDGYTFEIPSVFAESDIARRMKMGEQLVAKINLDNVDLNVTAAMNGGAATSLSGGIVRDMDTTVVKKHSSDEDEDGNDGVLDGTSSAGDSDINDGSVLYRLFETSVNEEIGTKVSSSTPELSQRSPDLQNETDSVHSKDSSYSYSNSSGFVPNQIKRVPSLKGFSAATKSADVTKFENNSLGSFNMTSKYASQPPRPSSLPTSAHLKARTESLKHSTDKGGLETTRSGGGSVVSSASSSDVTGSDAECQQALQRTYAFVALTLLERCIAQRDRVEEKFCRSEATVTTNRSRNSSFRATSEIDTSNDLTMDGTSHSNVVFAVREFLDTTVGAKAFSAIAPNASLVDQSTTRLLKLVGERYFDSCLPNHMENAKRLAEGAFGNVYAVNCPPSCSRCYSRRPMSKNYSKSMCEDSVTLSGEDTVYVVKRIARERTVYDLPVLIDVYAEVTCLEILSRNCGVCRLFNYGVLGGEYWLVLEEGKQDLLHWRQSLLALSERCCIEDVLTCIALYEDACAIVQSVHDAGIVHFDIKCSNFILRSHPKIALQWWSSRKHHDYDVIPSGILFLADFGESIVCKPGGENSSVARGNSKSFSETTSVGIAAASPKRGGPTVLTSPKFRTLLKEEIWPGVDVKRARGTLFVQSPEMVTISSGTKASGLPQNERRSRQKKTKKEGWISFSSPSYSSDVWSLGCLFVELLTMKPLLSERPWPELYCLLCMTGKKESIDAVIFEMLHKFMNSSYVSSCSTTCQQIFGEVKKLVPKILVQMPAERPSIAYIMATLGTLYGTYHESSSEGGLSSSPPNAGSSPALVGVAVPAGANMEQSSVDSWDPNFSEASVGHSKDKSPKGKKSAKGLKIATSGSALNYADQTQVTRVPQPKTPEIVINVSALPSGLLYSEVREYILSATDSLDNAKMSPFTCCIGPKLFVSLSVVENDSFSYDLSNALVVDITTAPSALYEYSTPNILGECMNKVRNCEKFTSIATHNSELVQKTLGYLLKQKRLIEIFLVSVHPTVEELNPVKGSSETAGGCFFFKLKKKKANATADAQSSTWVPWGAWRKKKIYASDEDADANSRRQVYKFNLGIGDPNRFFEAFKHAVIFVRECTEAGNTVVLSIVGRMEAVTGRDADERSRAGSSRWTIQNDGPAPALSARSVSFESNMRKLFHSNDHRAPSARSIADSREGESSAYPSTVGTRMSTSSGTFKPLHGDFSRPLVSALTALTSFAAVMTKNYSSFYEQPVAPVEKMAPWLLRGSQKETVVCLLQFSRNIVKFKSLQDSGSNKNLL